MIWKVRRKRIEGQCILYIFIHFFLYKVIHMYVFPDDGGEHARGVHDDRDGP